MYIWLAAAETVFPREYMYFWWLGFEKQYMRILRGFQ